MRIPKITACLLSLLVIGCDGEKTAGADLGDAQTATDTVGPPPSEAGPREDGGAPPQQTTWALGFGDGADESGSSLAVDNAGNVVLVGNFMGQLDLGGAILDSPTAIAGFIASFDAEGTHRWSKAMGESGKTYARSVGLDSAGRIVVVGDFSDGLEIGSATMQSAGRTDIFVASFDATGNARWAKRFGGDSWDTATGLALSSSGDLFVGGDFSGSIMLDSETLSNAGGTDALLVRIDSEGAVVWARGYGGAADDRIYDLALAPSDGLVVGGYYRQTMGVGDATLTAKGNVDGFVASLSQTGAARWAATLGGPDGYAEVSGVAVDDSGRIAVIGGYSGGLELLDQSYPGSEFFEIFVASFAADGSGRWASVHDRGYPVDVAIDGDQRVIVSGQLMPGGGDFGAGLETFGMADIFLAAFAADGNHSWSRSFGSGKDDRGAGLAIAPQGGAIWQTGSTSGNVTFGATTLSNAGGRDIFVARHAP